MESGVEVVDQDSPGVINIKKSHELVQASNIFDQQIDEGTAEEIDGSPNKNGDDTVNYGVRTSYKFSGSISKSSCNNIAKPPTVKKKTQRVQSTDGLMRMNQKRRAQNYMM